MNRKSYAIFVAWFLGFCFGLPLALYLLRIRTGFDLSFSAVAFMPMMLASLLAGVRFARVNCIAPDGGQMCVIALKLTVLALATSLLFVLLILALLPEVTGQMPLPVFFRVALGAFVIYWLIGRVFFGLGVKAQMKHMER